MQAIEVPEAAGREERAVFISRKEEQPTSTSIFIAADETKHGSYDCEYCGMANVRKSIRQLDKAMRTYKRHG